MAAVLAEIADTLGETFNCSSNSILRADSCCGLTFSKTDLLEPRRARTSAACSSSAIRSSSACIGTVIEAILDAAAPRRSSVSRLAGVTVRHANGRARSGEVLDQGP